MSKITMAVVFGAGYVLGARAGRERYNEIAERAKTVWESPTVQEQTAKIQDKAKEQTAKVSDKAKQRLPGGAGGGSGSRQGDDSAAQTSGQGGAAFADTGGKDSIDGGIESPDRVAGAFGSGDDSSTDRSDLGTVRTEGTGR